jgi:nitroimidazol reductase NimA-like FMN-containing flavoprotein (pyridoxamine 5'-phosphate oxidase superfamily)
MRRKDREISDASSIHSFIKKATVCRLGMINGDKPYVVPLCFGFQDNVLYFHSAVNGQKIDCLRSNPNVCFELDLITETLASEEPCDWGMKYQSVIGFGKAIFIKALDEKRQALTIIMRQYSDQRFQFPENKVKATAIFKVEIESMTAKQSGF